MRIAIVEDNSDLREELEFLISHAGHQVEGMSSAKPLYRLLESGYHFDMLILDLGLPDESGFNVAEKLKDMPGMGIVMLTARGHIQDRIHGLEMGADAYLTKPVDVTEMMAVINSVYRRLQVSNHSSQSPEKAVSFYMDESFRKLFLSNNKQIALTHSEGIILKILAQHGQDPVSRRKFSEALGQDYMQYDERRLEAIVSRLRKKLKDNCPETDVIKAARGIGYQLLETIEMFATT